jgi:hypothetical protein
MEEHNTDSILRVICGLLIIIGFMILVILGYISYRDKYIRNDNPYDIIHEQHRIIDELTKDVAQRDQWIWDAHMVYDSLPEIKFSRYYDY